jgi:hypothetical protein
MLPILRLIPVGGVTLALVILMLALNAPGGSRPPLPRDMMPARGALIVGADHPEWPQVLIRAALRRADELKQLRQLPDDRAARERAAADKKSDNMPQVAGVPDNRSEAEPEGATATIVQSQDVVIPVDIGEASSTELPVSQDKEGPPGTKTPQRSKPAKESLRVAPEPAKPADSVKITQAPDTPARKPARRIRRAKPAPAAVDPAQFNLLAAFFASFNVEQPAVNRRR